MNGCLASTVIQISALKCRLLCTAHFNEELNHTVAALSSRENPPGKTPSKREWVRLHVHEQHTLKGKKGKPPCNDFHRKCSLYLFWSQPRTLTWFAAALLLPFSWWPKEHQLQEDNHHCSTVAGSSCLPASRRMTKETSWTLQAGTAKAWIIDARKCWELQFRH